MEKHKEYFLLCKKYKAQLKNKKLEIPSFQLQKNGQLKIQQMAFMLIAVTIFFVLVGMFVLAFKFSDLKKTATDLEEKNAMLLVTKLANSPELSCGEAFGTGKTNCIDTDKVIVLNKKDYEGFWGNANIEIRKIYPKTNGEDVVCELNNYPNCDIIKVSSGDLSGFDTSNFVALCRKESSDSGVNDKCELGKLIVNYKSTW
ncbi:hypothetical protein COU55_03230 [Candidatus Pacearchaeota archaeon CG10_big_fil_rev_8_21_14_0_10_31_59]|nr:MAG: hypothetical protein COU55_03230 [Candidatus Pacearchaeota archaeon CG10_big_fil_rev_8_21_14_0_10_31_59]